MFFSSDISTHSLDVCILAFDGRAPWSRSYAADSVSKQDLAKNPSTVSESEAAGAISKEGSGSKAPLHSIHACLDNCKPTIVTKLVPTLLSDPGVIMGAGAIYAAVLDARKKMYDKMRRRTNEKEEKLARSSEKKADKLAAAEADK